MRADYDAYRRKQLGLAQTDPDNRQMYEATSYDIPCHKRP